MSEIINIILGSAEDAFIQVSVFVGAVLLLFGYINYKQSGKFIESIENSKKFQPIIGAVLGLTPGCGGAIFIMPLYVKGKITYGTLIATLIATMGDSAFVLISTSPLTYLLISIISFIVAVPTGYLIDRMGIAPKVAITKSKKAKELREKGKKVINQSNYFHYGHNEGDEIHNILHKEIKGHQKESSLGYYITHKGFLVYWIVLFLGLILGIMALFQVDINGLQIKSLGAIIGVSGTAVSIFMMIMSRKFIGDDTHEESEIKVSSLKETFIHCATETAFVATWVFFAYLIYEFSILILGGGVYSVGVGMLAKVMTTAGLLAVLVGALIGIIPGCGPQVIFVTLYSKGMIPFAALIANAISQDGDALFPLLAMDKKASLWATIITTIPALLVGLLIFFIEMFI
ncbi:putative manganese transporter [Oceanirhabdus seepicola]|uniref:Arsenic efflux protein n=1 Tax=Oceanirhabdus seepicola TaxID=2828781 RepID=A0A9J6NYQ8_9CLOT|nr:putative manganese transporter [Oceanirhabdus seepicola]MCM1989188.1 arsenic efflux protein [Oceanirhabdus seepicola]